MREAAAKIGLSHTAINAIIKGTETPSPGTIKKLAAFAGDHHQAMVLEDELLTLAGYRSTRPDPGLSEPLARLLDKLGGFSTLELTLVEHFTDFISNMRSKK